MSDFTAVYLPNCDKDKSGFLSEEKAYKYIERFCCSPCRNRRALCLKMKRKGIWISEEDFAKDFVQKEENKAKDGYEIWDEYDSIYGSEFMDCDASWLIIETEKYNECETFPNLFDAAGFERINPENESWKDV